MTQTSACADCVTGLNLNFGPHKQLPYKDAALADVYVITSGGLGTIGIKSAENFGDVIVFEFKTPLCAEWPARHQANHLFLRARRDGHADACQRARCR